MQLQVRAKGVDSVGQGFKNPALFVRDLARRESTFPLACVSSTLIHSFLDVGCIVVLSGKTDYVSDGTTVVSLNNGHPLLGDITGSGCMLGTCIAIFCAAASMEATPEDGKLVSGDMFVAAIGGCVPFTHILSMHLSSPACSVLALTLASEKAAARDDVKGSGTFLPALIDELGKLSPEEVVALANVEVVSV